VIVRPKVQAAETVELMMTAVVEAGKTSDCNDRELLAHSAFTGFSGAACRSWAAAKSLKGDPLGRYE
jgi:hypothetical protein